MKNIISILFVSLFLIGCAPKSVDINTSVQNENKNVNLGTEIKEDKTLGTEIQTEEIGVFEPNDIIEDEISVVEYKETVNIAFAYPSKVIGRYAKSSMNTMLGYFDYKKLNYNIKVFDSQNETPENIADTFERIKDSGITKVIALYSPKALESLHSLDTDDLQVYLPLTNKNELLVDYNENFIYGGISYDDQINTLLSYSSINNVMFYQESFLGKNLKEKYEAIVPEVSIVRAVQNKRNNFKALVEDERLNDTTIFLNTSLVKSSILLSQFTVYEIEPRVILSTQVNYNPKLISLTQEKDRLNFVISNSIDKVDDLLVDTMKTYGADVEYNWVDYSTLVGINYLYDANESLVINTLIEDNQVKYVPKLFKSTAFGFLEIK